MIRSIIFTFPPTLLERAAVKKKLALHIFKLVGGLATAWPRSVPETPGRQVVVDQMVARFRAINLVLLIFKKTQSNYLHPEFTAHLENLTGAL